MKNISGLAPVSFSPILSETSISKYSEVSFQALLNTKMQPLHTTKANVEFKEKKSTLPTVVNRPDLDGLVAQLLASRKMLMNTTSKLSRKLVMPQTTYPTTPFIYYYIWIPVPFIELKVGLAKVRKLNRKKLNPLQTLQLIHS
mgnify:FL=1